MCDDTDGFDDDRLRTYSRHNSPTDDSFVTLDTDYSLAPWSPTEEDQSSQLTEYSEHTIHDTAGLCRKVLGADESQDRSQVQEGEVLSHIAVADNVHQSRRQETQHCTQRASKGPGIYGDIDGEGTVFASPSPKDSLSPTKDLDSTGYAECRGLGRGDTNTDQNEKLAPQDDVPATDLQQSHDNQLPAQGQAQAQAQGHAQAAQAQVQHQSNESPAQPEQKQQQTQRRQQPHRACKSGNYKGARERTAQAAQELQPPIGPAVATARPPRRRPQPRPPIADPAIAVQHVVRNTTNALARSLLGPWGRARGFLSEEQVHKVSAQLDKFIVPTLLSMMSGNAGGASDASVDHHKTRAARGRSNVGKKRTASTADMEDHLEERPSMRPRRSPRGRAVG